MPLQIHITAGSRKGQRLLADGAAALSFGREADNALVIDLPEVSRKHGELTPQPDGSWHLVNHSPNGTQAGGKKVTTKPFPLAGEVSIRVGTTEVLRLIAPVPAATAAQPQSADAPAVANPRKGRLKLLLGVVCGLSVCFMLYAIVAPMFQDKQDAAPAAHAVETWPRAEIHALIAESGRVSGETDSGRYETLMAKAHSLYAPGKPMGRDAWFAAYRAWRKAAGANQGDFRDAGDRHDYGIIQAKIEDYVWRDYLDATLAYHRRDSKQAGTLLGKILDYAGGEDPLFGGKFRDHLWKLKGLAQAKPKKKT